ncbi:uncharacterized protein I206_101883 [Kwoniella pini CBS 10737]|uniref:Uncharacterized protein n=1 Tax=Kwoniella pini CBS 10737 TaxID=1296096 RepID=A0A1B9HVG0_9TREE|nr:uncharacterized protein I206_07026 [Kwoniella pini CBS 10737]OCF47248.1 hypothetical protein I206_07026 [Kwoniella pini CBS 10737]
MSNHHFRLFVSRRNVFILFFSIVILICQFTITKISINLVPISISSVFLPTYDNLYEDLAISTTSAGDHGTFVETSPFDLPRLIKSKSNQRGFKQIFSSPEEVQEVTINGEDLNKSDQLRIAVLEHAGFHEEVVGAVLKTLTDLEVNFTLYRDNFRWGYEKVLENGMNYTINPTPYSDGTFVNSINNNEIDIILHISCDRGFWNWPRNLKSYESMKLNKNLEIICMLHELENLNEEERKSWEIAVNQNRLTYLTLSKHVKNYLKHEILKWSHILNQPNWGKIKVEEFIPIFPVDTNKLPDSEKVKVSIFYENRDERIPSRLAIIGNIQPWRRNYNPILADLHKSLQADPGFWGYLPLSSEPNATYIPANDHQKPPVTLHFIGSINPKVQLEIPESMRDMVNIHADLSYSDFYRLLGSMDLVLPAFVGWTYLEKKLSSAIPAAIVSRVPILGSELLLNAYQFLRNPAIELHSLGLREIEAIELLRKGIDPYTNLSKYQNDVSSNTIEQSSIEPQPLLPKINHDSRFGGRTILQGKKEMSDDFFTTDNSVNYGNTDWEVYHQNIYKANQEMMSDLFIRLAKRIHNRKMSSNQP